MLRSIVLCAVACGATAFLPTPAVALRSTSTGSSLSSKGVPHNLGPRPQATSTAISMGPVLFGSRSSRSPLVEWMLVETKTEYTHKEERNGLPNPFGQIPGFIDGSVEIFESGAILLYIADKYGSGASTPEERAKYTKWVVWANSALDKSLFTANIERAAPSLLTVLDKELEGREYLTGEFSVADVAVASYLLFIPMFHPDFSVSRFPNVLAYMERCCAREGYQKAFSANGARATAYCNAQKVMAGPQKKAFGLF